MPEVKKIRKSLVDLLQIGDIIYSKHARRTYIIRNIQENILIFNNYDGSELKYKKEDLRLRRDGKLYLYPNLLINSRLEKLNKLIIGDPIITAESLYYNKDSDLTFGTIEKISSEDIFFKNEKGYFQVNKRNVFFFKQDVPQISKHFINIWKK